MVFEPCKVRRVKTEMSYMIFVKICRVMGVGAPKRGMNNHKKAPTVNTARANFYYYKVRLFNNNLFVGNRGTRFDPGQINAFGRVTQVNRVIG